MRQRGREGRKREKRAVGRNNGMDRYNWVRESKERERGEETRVKGGR